MGFSKRGSSRLDWGASRLLQGSTARESTPDAFERRLEHASGALKRSRCYFSSLIRRFRQRISSPAFFSALPMPWTWSAITPSRVIPSL